MFQTVLGHDVKSAQAASELMGRAVGRIFPLEENVNQAVASPKKAGINPAPGLASSSPAPNP